MDWVVEIGKRLSGEDWKISTEFSVLRIVVWYSAKSSDSVVVWIPSVVSSVIDVTCGSTVESMMVDVLMETVVIGCSQGTLVVSKEIESFVVVVGVDVGVNDDDE